MSQLQTVEMHYLGDSAVTWMDQVCNEEEREGLGQKFVIGKVWRKQSAGSRKITMHNANLVKMVHMKVKWKASDQKVE